MNKLNRLSILFPAVVMLYGCSDDQQSVITPSEDRCIIQIGDVTAREFQSTRAEEANLSSLMSGFKVICESSDPAYEFENTLTYIPPKEGATGGKWRFVDGAIYEWPMEDEDTGEKEKLNFYAVYPSDRDCYTMYTSSDMVNYFRGMRLEGYLLDHDVDLMLASAVDMTRDNGKQGVAFNFQHVMTKLSVGISLRSELSNEYDGYSVVLSLEDQPINLFNLDRMEWVVYGLDEGGDMMAYYEYKGDMTLDANPSSPTFLPLGEAHFVYPREGSVKLECYGLVKNGDQVTRRELVSTMTGNLDLTGLMGKAVTVHLTATMTGDGNRPLDDIQTGDDPISEID